MAMALVSKAYQHSLHVTMPVIVPNSVLNSDWRPLAS